MSGHILIASDSLESARVWAYALRQRGHRPELAVRPEDALRLVKERSPDLAVVDVYAQENRWLDFCADLRRQGVSPVIVLAPSTDESYILAAYACGVDEVALKPLSPLILLAKVESWLRTVWSGPATSLEPLTAGNMTLDPESRTLCIDGHRSFRLTNLETRLLQSLIESPGHALSADRLIERLWGPRGADAAMLKNVVYRLRRKIEPPHTRQHHLVTVPGQGYRLRVG